MLLSVSFFVFFYDCFVNISFLFYFIILLSVSFFFYYDCLSFSTFTSSFLIFYPGFLNDETNHSSFHYPFLFTFIFYFYILLFSLSSFYFFSYLKDNNPIHFNLYFFVFYILYIFYLIMNQLYSFFVICRFILLNINSKKFCRVFFIIKKPPHTSIEAYMNIS